MDAGRPNGTSGRSLSGDARGFERHPLSRHHRQAVAGENQSCTLRSSRLGRMPLGQGLEDLIGKRLIRGLDDIGGIAVLEEEHVGGAVSS